MLVLVGALVFLYLPIAVVVVMAFNESGSPFRWSGFSTRWFGELADAMDGENVVRPEVIQRVRSEVREITTGGRFPVPGIEC